MLHSPLRGMAQLLKEVWLSKARPIPQFHFWNINTNPLFFHSMSHRVKLNKNFLAGGTVST